MAKLPTRDDLGGLPSVKSGAVTPNVRVATPDISAAGQGAVRAAGEKGRALVEAMDLLGQSQIRAAERVGQSALRLAQARGESEEIIAKGYQSLALGIGSIAEAASKRQAEDDALALARADADLKLRNVKRTRELIANDPDYKGWGDKYLAGSQADLDEVAANIPNGSDREKFLITAELERGLTHEKLLGEAYSRDRIAKVAGVTETLNKLEERFALATTDAERAEVEGEYKRTIDGAVALGLVDDLDALKLLDGSKQLVKALAVSHIDTDPEGYLRESRKRGGRALDLTSEAEGTSDRIAWRHGFASGYDVPLGHGAYGRPAKPLTEMTLEEAYAFGRQILDHPDNPHDSSALGRYQIVGRTMKRHMEEAGLTWQDKFSPENQDKLAAVIFKHEGFGAWEGFKRHPELLALAKTSVDAPSGRYAGLDPKDRLELDAIAQGALTKVGSVHEAKLWLTDGRAIADLTDPNTKKRLDALTEEAPQRFFDGDQNYFDEVVLGLFKTKGVISSKVKGGFEILLTSDDPSKREWALDNMMTLRDVNPDAFARDMDKKHVQEVERWRLVDQYLKPEMRAKRWERWRDPAMAAEKDRLLELGRKSSQADVDDDALNQRFTGDTWWPGDAAEPPPELHSMMPMLRNVWRDAYADAWAYHGNGDAASAEADAIVNDRFGISKIGGTSRVMDRPPHRQYNEMPGDPDGEWTVTQAKDLLSEKGYGDAEYMLWPDGNAKDALGNQYYHVFILNGDVPLKLPERLTFDFNLALKKRKAQ